MTTDIVLLAVLLGLIPAFIAKSKGYSFAAWWLFGAALLVVALPYALLMGANEDTRQQCPWCKTVVDKDARICRQCQRDIHEFYAAGLGESPKPRHDNLRPWER